MLFDVSRTSLRASGMSRNSSDVAKSSLSSEKLTRRPLLEGGDIYESGMR